MVSGCAGVGYGTSICIQASIALDFPTTPGAYDTTFNGGEFDAFVATLNTTGTALAYATFLGGSDDDSGYAIAWRESGKVYLTGLTTSFDFPTTPGAFDATANGDNDVFVAKLNAEDDAGDN